MHHPACWISQPWRESCRCLLRAVACSFQSSLFRKTGPIRLLASTKKSKFRCDRKWTRAKPLRCIPRLSVLFARQHYTRVDSVSDIRSSNWNRQELTAAQARAALGSQSASNSIDLSSGVSKQVEYAAMDVWVALRLYQQNPVSINAPERRVRENPVKVPTSFCRRMPR